MKLIQIFLSVLITATPISSAHTMQQEPFTGK